MSSSSGLVGNSQGCRRKLHRCAWQIHTDALSLRHLTLRPFSLHSQRILVRLKHSIIGAASSAARCASAEGISHWRIDVTGRQQLVPH
jgi:hypothetical protein